MSRNPTLLGFFCCLAASLACTLIAFWPEKYGVRIPVHCADGKMGYINESGQMVIAAKWDRASAFGINDKAWVSSEHKLGRWDKFLGFLKILGISRVSGGHFTIDRNGNKTPQAMVSSSLLYSAVNPPDSHGMMLVSNGRSYFWITKDGREAIPGVWDQAHPFKQDDPAAVAKNGKWGFINRMGVTVLPFEWDRTHGFDGNGRACVSRNGKWGVIDRQGNWIVPLYFQYLEGFDDQGMCAATMTSGAGFIDAKGKIAIPFRYRYTESFDRFGMAKTQILDATGSNRTGWIDRSGATVIPFIYHNSSSYEWTSRFKDHELLPVFDLKSFYLIDRKGRVIITCGNLSFTHIEDPIAPGKFWIARTADPNWHYPRQPFRPACYDQNGKLIWQGSTSISKRQTIVFAYAFGVIAALLFALQFRTRTT